MRYRRENEFEKILSSLPNGLHDAGLYEVTTDLVHGSCSLLLAVDTSSPEERSRLPSLRRARLTLDGLTYFEMEPVRVRDWSEVGGYVSIDVGSVEETRPTTLGPEEVPPGSWAYWVFINETNSFIRFVARSARWEWLE